MIKLSLSTVGESAAKGVEISPYPTLEPQRVIADKLLKRTF